MQERCALLKLVSLKGKDDKKQIKKAKKYSLYGE